MPLAAGDVFVLCSDGIFEAFDEAGQEFGAAARDRGRSSGRYTRPAKEIVDELFAAVQHVLRRRRAVRRPDRRGREDQSAGTGNER